MNEQALRERVDILEEENRQLRAALHGDGPVFPKAWKLTPTEGDILRRLLARQVLNRNDYLAWAEERRGRDYADSRGTLDVLICRLRHKLARLGVCIEKRWGEGYALAPASKARLKALLQGALGT